MQAVEMSPTGAHPGAKRCTKCGVRKPRSEFGAHRKYKDGKDTQCRACKRAQDKAYRLNNPEKVTAVQRRYYEANADRVKAKTAAWREANPEAVLEEKRRYRRRHRERLNDYKRDYYAKHQDRCRSYVQNWRARDAGTHGEVTGEEIRAQFEMQEGRCHWCGTSLSNGFEIDHVIPLARGGGNTIDNIVASCTPCNRSKGNQLPDEWEGPGGR